MKRKSSFFTRMLSGITSAAVLASMLSGIPVLAQSNMLYSTADTVHAGNEERIPIYISGNTGIAGFGVYITYDPDVVTPIEIDDAEGLISGCTENSIGGNMASLPEHTVKVMYAGTENMSEDGLLFDFVCSIDTEAIGSTVLQISYEQGDTIDEEIEDVILSCEDVTLVIENEAYDAMPALVLSSGNVTAGEETTVEAVLSNSGALSCADFAISYDAKQFAYVSVSSDAHAVISQIRDDEGVLSFTVSGIDQVSDHSILFTITFDSADTADAGTYEFTGTASCTEGAEDIHIVGCRCVVFSSEISDAAVISGEEGISGDCGDVITIPVYISNNKGITGYKLFLNYHHEYLTPITVADAGLFPGTFTCNTDKEDQVVVLWNHSDNVFENGHLFDLQFQVNTEEVLDTEIAVGYSQPDTFFHNDSEGKDYDVTMLCHNITVSLNAPETTTTTMQTTTVTTTTTETTTYSDLTTTSYTTDTSGQTTTAHTTGTSGSSQTTTDTFSSVTTTYTTAVSSFTTTAASQTTTDISDSTTTTGTTTASGSSTSVQTTETRSSASSSSTSDFTETTKTTTDTSAMETTTKMTTDTSGKETTTKMTTDTSGMETTTKMTTDTSATTTANTTTSISERTTTAETTTHTSGSISAQTTTALSGTVTTEGTTTEKTTTTDTSEEETTTTTTTTTITTTNTTEEETTTKTTTDTSGTATTALTTSNTSGMTTTVTLGSTETTATSTSSVTSNAETTTATTDTSSSMETSVTTSDSLIPTTVTTETTETSDTTTTTETTTESSTIRTVEMTGTQTVSVGETIQLVIPDDMQEIETWSSSDADTASVDEDGIVHILKKGTVLMTAIAKDGTVYEVTLTTEPLETPSVLRGDADCDGSITLADASMVLAYYAQHAAGNTSYTFQEDAILEAAILKAVDIDGDESITIADAGLILTYYARCAVGADIEWEDLL